MKIPKQKRDVAVWDAMDNKRWHTLAGLSKKTGFPEASVSCQLRDFRKKDYHFQTVNRRLKKTTNKKQVIYEYQLITRF